MYGQITKHIILHLTYTCIMVTINLVPREWSCGPLGMRLGDNKYYCLCVLMGPEFNITHSCSQPSMYIKRKFIFQVTLEQRFECLTSLALSCESSKTFIHRLHLFSMMEI